VLAALALAVLVGAGCAQDGGTVDVPGNGNGGGGGRTATTTTIPVDPEAVQGVTPGAFCSPEGAKGQTVTGIRMTCTRTAGDERARWRAA
jgi:hypothetical protein